jgi:hypothetical protein
MDADMAQTFSNKLDKIAEMAGGEEAKTAVQGLVDSLLGGTIQDDGTVLYDDSYTDEERRAI